MIGLHKIAGLALALLAGSALVSGASATLVNVAPTLGTASQSSTAYGGVASLAIDGNTDGNYFDGSVTHTGLSNAALGNYNIFDVTFGSDIPISGITIWNRTDAESGDLNSFYLQVINSANVETYSQLFQTVPNPSLSVSFATPVLGDMVQVFQTTDNTYLQLAEVQVFSDNGIPSPVPEPASVTLLAIGLFAAYRTAKSRRGVSSAI